MQLEKMERKDAWNMKSTFVTIIIIIIIKHL